MGRAGRWAVISGFGSGTPAVQRAPELCPLVSSPLPQYCVGEGLCRCGVTYQGESAAGNAVSPVQPWLPELLLYSAGLPCIVG